MNSAYLIGGDLTLPDPQSSGITGAHLSLAQRLQPLFKQLDDRDLSELSKPISNLDESFEAFATGETSIWEVCQQKSLSTDDLVKVSGSLRSPLAYQGNQPSYTTTQRQNGETADPTNPCIAMVMGTAFEPDFTLIYDRLLRRDENSEGLKNYPQEVAAYHEGYVQAVRESSEAKVEVILGAKVRKRILKDTGFKYDVLPLWGEYEGIMLILDHESNYANARDGQSLRRIMLFAYHPNRFFYRNKNESLTQDKYIEIAAKIARVNYTRGYYRDQKWQTCVPPNHSSLMKKKYLEAYLLEAESNLEKDLTALTSVQASAQHPEPNMQSGRWEMYFADERPHSIKELEMVLAEAEATNTIGDNVHQWESPAEFPAPVLHWFSRLKKVLFANVSVDGLAEIIPVYERLCVHPTDVKTASLRTMIYSLIQTQMVAIKEIRKSSNDDLLYPGYKPVEVICSSCREPLPTDTHAKWLVNRPDLYAIFHFKKCTSSKCKGKKVLKVPKDPSIESVSVVPDGRITRPRFVPVDPTIPSMYKKMLIKFAADWKAVAPELKAEVLKMEASSSQVARKKRPVEVEPLVKLKSRCLQWVPSSNETLDEKSTT